MEAAALHHESTWTCKACTFDRNDESQDTCSMCYETRPSVSWFPSASRPFTICRVSNFFSTVISGALTGTFALVGAISGSITGALACRSSQCSLLQGAGLGAVAGAVLSIEVLEASRTYWHSERSGSSAPPSMTDFFEDLLNGRFVREFLAPAIASTERFQINFSEMSYEDLFEVFLPAEGRLKGASEEFLSGLPHHEVTKHNKIDGNGDSICCTICLQELEQGDTARALPNCNHTFHLSCVDQWLERHMVCPMCRQHLS